ncbi:PHB depolymerase family esterase [Sphaerisporangium sp. TRM90804]|uniref:extracellular catalytic domain type 1 short-chain-length polyhydroxyalkanoate depolymerase n=1 Tax=Sphaerisporangium sp. TRM90804 TaxID=3031113 RepID=UPI00244A7F31|nr:PHB depolymerase family esterase [Sphaerisporangium sp. TRM90804]MDH2428328.1 PHB depolymerase family esterase [Sphaerisporangium sp. TRM90804]
MAVPRPARRLARLASLVLIGLLAAAALVAPARAASLTQVTSFGSNPGNLAMYAYRPDGLPAGRPLVVLLHGCTQNASGYFANSGWRKYADQQGFTLVLPQTSSANNSSSCFNWFQTGDTGRGQGEAASIRSMVDHAVRNYGADPARVFVSGLSAGGAMTAVMLATYPDVFAAGSIGAGLAYRCASSLVQASGCQYQATSKTPQQWGDLVRGAYPGYAGRYPRVAVWQGLSDYTVVPANGTQLRDQWTNVRGVSQTPTATRSLTGGTSLKVYGDDDVRLYEITGMGHGLPVDPGGAADQCGTAAAYFLDTICSAHHDAQFFGLAGGTGPQPTPTPTPTATPTPTPTPGACVTASNYAHTTAGRAYQSGGMAYATGSGDALGLWNTFTVRSLRQTGPAYWVLAAGGC